jgi:hypothetical protein
MLELALDASVAPSRVLLCDTDDEPANLRWLGWAAGPSRIGSAPRHEGSVPAHDRLRTNEQRGPAPSRQNAAGGSKQYAVVWLEAWPLYRAAEDVELVAENHDFDLFGFFGPQGKDDDLKKATQNPIAERQDDEAARTRLHERRRLRHPPIGCGCKIPDQ